MLNHQTTTVLVNSTLFVLLAATPVLAADTEQMIRDAIAHHDQGEYEASIELLRDVLKQEPGNGFAAYELAYSLQANGDLDNCAKVAGRAVRKIRKDEEQAALLPQLSMMQASCYSAAGKTRKALKTFRSALEDNPDDFWLHFNISITLAKTEQMEEAISHLQSAIRIEPEHPSPWYVIGGAYYETGQALNAVFAYTNFLQREFNTERCVNAARWLIDAMHSHVQKDSESGATTIFLPESSADDSPDATTLAMLLALSSVSLTPDTEAGQREADSAAAAISNFLALAGAMALDSDPDSFFAEHLMSGTRSIEGDGVGMAFSYFVTSVAGMDGADEWLRSHTAETDALVGYFESRPSMQQEQ